MQTEVRQRNKRHSFDGRGAGGALVMEGSGGRATRPESLSRESAPDANEFGARRVGAASRAARESHRTYRSHRTHRSYGTRSGSAVPPARRTYFGASPKRRSASAAIVLPMLSDA